METWIFTLSAGIFDARRTRTRAETISFDDDDESDSEESSPDAAVSDSALQAWDAQQPYMNDLRAAQEEALYATYLRLRPRYRRSPSFFLEAAEVLFARGKPSEGLRVLSNVCELATSQPDYLLRLAARLQEHDRGAEALDILRQLCRAEPKSPYLARELAAALERQGRLPEAYPVWRDVVLKPWELAYANGRWGLVRRQDRPAGWLRRPQSSDRPPAAARLQPLRSR